MTAPYMNGVRMRPTALKSVMTWDMLKMTKVMMRQTAATQTPVTPALKYLTFAGFFM